MSIGFSGEYATLLGYPVQCFITLKARQLFLVIKQRIKSACSKVQAPGNLSIPRNGLEGLSHPTYLQTGVYALQPSQNDSCLLPSLNFPENDIDKEPL